MRPERVVPAWLTPQHDRLLRALLGDEYATLAAFTEWTLHHDWNDQLDPGAFRLLPALYRKLETTGIVHPSLGRLRGLYRRSWYRNQGFLGEWAGAFAALRERDIDPLLLGGAAVAAGYAAPTGVRYLDECDLLVRPEHLDATVRTLEARDWRFAPRTTAHGALVCDDRRAEPGKLRWRPLATATASDTGWFRTGVRDADFNGAALAVPAPHALLLNLLAGMNEQAPMTGCVLIADVAALLGDPRCDAQALLERAREHGLTGRLGAVLRYLESLSLPLPLQEGMLQALGRDRTRLAERLELRIFADTQRERERIATPPLATAAAYLRCVDGLRPWPALRRLPGFLRGHYRSQSLAAIVRRLCVNGLRRTFRVLGRGRARAAERLQHAESRR